MWDNYSDVLQSAVVVLLDYYNYYDYINDAKNTLRSSANICDLLYLEYFILVQHLFLT